MFACGSEDSGKLGTAAMACKALLQAHRTAYDYNRRMKLAVLLVGLEHEAAFLGSPESA